ncbi:NADH-quinone oxidoreductase subunit NuoH [Lacihabitans sp. CS3-21]|jgi:NADH-quinone oxidoreductase subunit H|uniref:NADH-quinone oxidoreductase subunit NuoH n=1 Tax=Lacihabitans sp. CS3-21 TaxID=2487332 RepID=UPI0020CD6627|nr:NADH-quinone oxidoreductase subunit NuoH [Lacihabitans sp. CS3-21]MCP9748454.1 NADH-quinone oxidoreductase subunit NuoH [Lacihabitans sp. CS3-21]MDP1816484.1 NADH-quinone oxidoreductase subunit NuoH [Leadbetterella sp.]
MDTVLIVKAIIVIAIFAISMLMALYETYAERVIAAFIQDRVGPDRAGPFGLLQPLADGGKLFFKEDFIPTKADKWLFILGPAVAMSTALLSSAVIPFGDTIIVAGQKIDVQGMDVNIGILWIFGIVSLGVYGILIGGWASNNKYSLYGAIRAASQTISYELAMGISLLAIILMTGSLSVKSIVLGQHGIDWNIFYQPMGFLLFLTCSLAECNRTPFDLPESENELVAGYHTEYGSMKMGLYLFSEYVNMFISSAVLASLYLGGFNYPGMDFVYSKLVGSFGEVTGHNLATALGTLTLFLKIFFFIFLFMWIRWTLPRFRYDQLMNVAWKWMMPVAIVNLIITAAAELSGKPLLYNWVGLAIFGAIYFGLFPIFKKKTVSAN